MDVLKKVNYISKHIWLRYQTGCTQKYKVEFAYHAQGWGSSPATKIPRTKTKVQSMMRGEKKRKNRKTQRINHFHQNGNSNPDINSRKHWGGSRRENGYIFYI